MINDKKRIKGRITVRVLDKNGNVKNFQKSIWRKMFNLPPKKMVCKNHNTITNQGDGLIADWMLSSPTQNKVDANSGYMIVGTGWTGASAKANTNVNTATGTYKKLDSGYPQTSGAFGSSGQNVVLYRCTFDAGSLAANGINEVALMNGNNASASCLAYAQITPSVNITASDTLQIDWQITVSGS